MRHLNKEGIECSTPLKNKQGKTYVSCKNGKSHFLLQVLKFLPGKSVNATKLNSEEFKQVCHFSGEKLGRLHIASKVAKIYRLLRHFVVLVETIWKRWNCRMCP